MEEIMGPLSSSYLFGLSFDGGIFINDYVNSIPILHYSECESEDHLASLCNLNSLELSIFYKFIKLRYMV